MGVADRAHLLEDFGQLRARNHGVVHVEIRREATHRAERTFARAPEALPLRGVSRDRDLAGAGGAAVRARSLDLNRDCRTRAVELGDQHRARVGRHARGVDARLDRADRALIDDLERGSARGRS